MKAAEDAQMAVAMQGPVSFGPMPHRWRFLALLIPLAATAEASPETKVRVMTFNIHRGVEGLERIAGVIRAENPDVAALQEVDRGTRRSRHLDQAKVLARLTGLTHYRYFKARNHDSGEYGVALLSRFPIESAEHHALPVPGGLEPRVVGRALVNIHGRPVSVYVTHLSHLPISWAVRARQAQRILELFERDPHPKLLLGDMNEETGAQAVRLFARRLVNVFNARGEGPRGTYRLLPLWTLQLDHVFASSELVPVKSRVVETDASDHHAVVAEMELGGSAIATTAAAAAP